MQDLIAISHVWILADIVKIRLNVRILHRKQRGGVGGRRTHAAGQHHGNFQMHWRQRGDCLCGVRRKDFAAGSTVNRGNDRVKFMSARHAVKCQPQRKTVCTAEGNGRVLCAVFFRRNDAAAEQLRKRAERLHETNCLLGLRGMIGFDLQNQRFFEMFEPPRLSSESASQSDGFCCVCAFAFAATLFGLAFHFAESARSIDVAATAPSATAVTTWRSVLSQTSPAAKTPSMLVFCV